MQRKQIGVLCAALVALGLLGPAMAHLPASGAAAATSSSIALDGVVGPVDADRDRVDFTADDGRRYTLDTARADIALPGVDRPGETADLHRLMRVRVEGSRLSDDIIEADRVRVLSLPGDPPPSDAPAARDGDGISLRGTVKSVDQRRGSFVVHINDHTRTVFVDDSTRLTPLDADSPDRIPARPGDRATVTGVLRSDGTVMADTVSVDHPADAAQDVGAHDEVVGRVSQPSDPDSPRDIKIRVSKDREVRVHVPSGTPVTRNGHDISVRDLTTDDLVRVSGIQDGDDFTADRLSVVGAYEDDK